MRPKSLNADDCLQVRIINCYFLYNQLRGRPLDATYKRNFLTNPLSVNIWQLQSFLSNRFRRFITDDFSVEVQDFPELIRYPEYAPAYGKHQHGGKSKLANGRRRINAEMVPKYKQGS